jgi:hypothetical protein
VFGRTLPLFDLSSIGMAMIFTLKFWIFALLSKNACIMAFVHKYMIDTLPQALILFLNFRDHITSIKSNISSDFRGWLPFVSLVKAPVRRILKAICNIKVDLESRFNECELFLSQQRCYLV